MRIPTIPIWLRLAVFILNVCAQILMIAATLYAFADGLFAKATLFTAFGIYLHLLNQSNDYD